MPGLIGRDTLTTESIANFPTYPTANVNPADIYTAVANDEIDRIGAYLEDYYGSSNNIEVGIYEISGGVVGALVHSIMIDPVNASPQWYYSATGLGIALVAGREYVMAMCPTAVNSGRLFYLTVANSRDNGNAGTALLDPFVHFNYSGGSYLAFADVIAGGSPPVVAVSGKPGLADFNPLLGDF